MSGFPSTIRSSRRTQHNVRSLGGAFSGPVGKVRLAPATAAVVVIGAGFVVTFTMWRHMDEARAFALGVPYTNFNWKTVNAQNRGCNACRNLETAAKTE
jgi:hypothetical protein